MVHVILRVAAQPQCSFVFLSGCIHIDDLTSEVCHCVCCCFFVKFCYYVFGLAENFSILLWTLATKVIRIAIGSDIMYELTRFVKAS